MAFDIVRTQYTDSRTSFYVPPTSKSDYRNMLYTQMDFFTGTYTLLRDWYAQFDEDYEPYQFRGTLYPIDWKSKIGNSDMSDNFKTGHGDEFPELHKGDMLVSEDGDIRMLNWQVTNHINNQASQALRCNARLTIERWVGDEVDQYANLVEAAHWEVIVNELPCGLTPYQGRPDYSKAQNSPGVVADSLYSGQVQLNRQTRKLRINDEFSYCGARYRIVNIDWSETNINQTFGIININLRRVAGESMII